MSLKRTSCRTHAFNTKCNANSVYCTTTCFTLQKMTRCVILYAFHSWKHAFMIAIESMAAGNKKRNDSENKVQTIVSVDLQ